MGRHRRHCRRHARFIHGFERSFGRPIGEILAALREHRWEEVRWAKVPVDIDPACLGWRGRSYLGDQFGGGSGGGKESARSQDDSRFEKGPARSAVASVTVSAAATWRRISCTRIHARKVGHGRLQDVKVCAEYMVSALQVSTHTKTESRWAFLTIFEGDDYTPRRSEEVARLMKVFFLNLTFVAVAIMAFSGAVFPHHGTAAYDAAHLVTVKGTATDFQFRNPHVLLSFEVKGDNGKIQK